MLACTSPTLVQGLYHGLCFLPPGVPGHLLHLPRDWGGVARGAAMEGLQRCHVGLAFPSLVTAEL